MQSPFQLEPLETRTCPRARQGEQGIAVSRSASHLQNAAQDGNVVTLPSQDPVGNQTGVVVARIEGILESVLDDLLRKERSVSIPYRTRSSATRSRPRSDGIPGTASSSPLDRTSGRSEVLRFPGKTRREARKFGRLKTPQLSFASANQISHL